LKYNLSMHQKVFKETIERDVFLDAKDYCKNLFNDNCCCFPNGESEKCEEELRTCCRRKVVPSKKDTVCNSCVESTRRESNILQVMVSHMHKSKSDPVNQYLIHAHAISSKIIPGPNYGEPDVQYSKNRELKQDERIAKKTKRVRLHCIADMLCKYLRYE